MRFCILAVLSQFTFYTASAQVSGYQFHHEQGQYTSITDPLYTGAVVKQLNLQDDYASPQKIALPFPFSFAGKSVDSVGIHANGYLWFGPAGWGDLTIKWPISSMHPSSVKGIVSAYGMDMHPVAGSKLRCGYTGTPPVRMFVAEWEAMSREETANAQPDTITFQIRLYESSNRVEINYGPCLLAGTASTPVEVGIKGDNYGDYHNRILSGNWTVSQKGTSQGQRSQLSSSSKPGWGQILAWEFWQAPTAVQSAAPVSGSISIFPQPAQDRLFLSLPGNSAGFHWQIFDGAGRLQLNGVNAADQNDISVGSLAPGIYLLEARYGQQAAKAKFVKN